MKIPSDRMISTPLQDSFDCCSPELCAVKRLYLTGAYSLGEARMYCAACRKIYKFDKEIYNDRQATPKFTPYRGGKGETYFKRYSETVANLRAEGKTQKQISEILGISISSVNKICKKF